MIIELKNLIRNDLSLTLEESSEHVLSEESIRLLIAYLQFQGVLINAMVIRAENITTFFKTLHTQKTPGHFQVILESGQRSLLKQGEPDSIHYATMDVFCDAEGKLIVFIADHYHGAKYNSFRSDYASLNLPISFFVAGGTLHQTDKNNCIFFTLRHLELTAHDHELHQKFIQSTSHAHSDNDSYQPIPWFELDPVYNLTTQSFKTLVEYVAFTKRTEDPNNDYPELPATQLEEHHVDVSLAKTLESNDNDKLINKGIEAFAKQLVEKIHPFLDGVPEDQLVSICYLEKTFAYSLLMQAFIVSGNKAEHPLFAFIFSNQPALIFFNQFNLQKNKQAQNQKLFEIFNNTDVLFLMHCGLINPFELFQQMTSTDGKQLTLSPDKLQIAHANIELLANTNGLNQVAILNLLFLKNAAKIWSFEPYRRVFLKGLADINDIPRIRLPLLPQHELHECTDDELVLKIRNSMGTPSPTSVIDVDLTQYQSSFFSITKKNKPSNHSTEENATMIEESNETHW